MDDWDTAGQLRQTIWYLPNPKFHHAMSHGVTEHAWIGSRNLGSLQNRNRLTCESNLNVHQQKNA